LLNANASRLSSLRYGDAKVLPNTDVIVREGFDILPLRLLAGLDLHFNTSTWDAWMTDDGNLHNLKQLKYGMHV
jgi:hypothetical protein